MTTNQKDICIIKPTRVFTNDKATGAKLTVSMTTFHAAITVGVIYAHLGLGGTQ